MVLYIFSVKLVPNENLDNLRDNGKVIRLHWLYYGPRLPT